MRAAMGITLLLAGSALAVPPTLELPKEAAGDVAAFVQVPAKTTGKTVRWIALDTGLSVFPVDLLKDTKTAVVVASRPGRYRLMAITCAADEMSEPAICLIVIGDAPPGPDPPVPPGPDDALAKAFRAALASEAEADKIASVKSLAALYRQASADAFLSKYATWGPLFKDLVAARQTLVGEKILKVRQAVQIELVTSLPKDSAQALDAAGKTLATTTFSRVATALEGAAK